MRVFKSIAVIFAFGSVFGCGQKKEVADELAVVRDVVIVDISSDPIPDPPPPPPPSSKTTSLRFKNVKQWLVHIGQTEKAPQPGLTYHFSVVRKSDSSTSLYMYGRNEDHEASADMRKATFYPRDAYFQLYSPEFDGLALEKVGDRVASQLLDFFRSEHVKKTFFKDAKAFVTDWDGTHWPISGLK